MLELDSISAGYGKAQVLRDFSLSIRAGEIVCLLGRNGAGKTTCMKAIMGLLPLMSGRVLLDGQEVSALPAHHVPRAGIGYIPQGRRLFAGLSVAQNLEIGLRARGSGHDTLEEVLELFPRLRERMNQRAETLSGGEQQMLSTARALCLRPKAARRADRRAATLDDRGDPAGHRQNAQRRCRGASGGTARRCGSVAGRPGGVP